MIVFDTEALDDLDRIFEFLAEHDPEAAVDQIEKLHGAIAVLDQHPMIGRTIGSASTLRELVISQGRSGYVALYEYSAADEFIRIVAIRHQREAGFRGTLG